MLLVSQVFTGNMRFLSLDRRGQSTEGRKRTSGSSSENNQLYFM